MANAEISLVTIEEASNPKASVLHQVAEPITFPLSAEDQAFIASLKTKLFELGGVGLAAPQLGVAKRIMGLYITEQAAWLRDNAHPFPLTVFINPSYEGIPEAGLSADFEGCYSVQSTLGKFPRFNKIKVRYQDEKGQFHERIESNFFARSLQHEIDHLDGILITDRLTSQCVQGDYLTMLRLRRSELPVERQAVFDRMLAERGIELE